MTLPRKTPQSRPGADTQANDKGQARRMSSDSAELSSCASKKRPLPQSFEPAHVQHRVSQKQKPSGNTPPVGAAAKNQLGKTKTSPAMQPQTGLVKEVKTEIQDVALDSIQGGKCIGLPRNIGVNIGVQGRLISSSIQEKGHTTSGNWWNQQPRNLSTCSIDPNFLQRVVSAFEGVNKEQEGSSTRLANEAISTNPTFLAITEKYGDIAKDCLLESGSMRTSILKVICEVVQDLQKKRLTEVDRALMDSYYSIVKDAEKVKMNVSWLRTRLDEIKDAIRCIFDTKKINDERNRRAKQNEIEKKWLESKKAGLEKLKAEIDRQESQLKSNTLATEELSSKLSKRASRIQQFQNISLMEAFP